VSTDYVPVNIPKKLYEEIEKRVAESQGEFKNVEEYVEFVLSEIIKEEEEETINVSTPEEEEKLKSKLGKLSSI